MADIELIGLTKRFSGLTAVNEVDLQVGAGEVVCLLGPSGCGKTTMLRMIAGLEFATSGRVRLSGREVNNLAARDRNVAMVFQFYALYPNLSVRENIAFPLHADRLSRAQIDERCNRAARMLDLDDVMDRTPGQLAEGEKQRVAVGRAIVREPSCFLFDEPLSRLDVQLRETMRGQVKEVLTGLNKATVIVTHDQLEALTMADRIAVMRFGSIEQVASPHEIFAQPANLFVAGFIGTPQMNLLGATLIGGEGTHQRFRIGDQDVPIEADPAVAGLAADSPVTLGVRPRAFEVVEQGTADVFSATVDLIEPMGAEVLVHLVEDEHDIRVVVDRDVGVRFGERLSLRLRPGQTHVFDRSERRVCA